LIRADRQSVQNSESPQFGSCSSLRRHKSIRPHRIGRNGTARTTDSGRQLMPIMNKWWNDKTNSITAAIESIRRASSPISRNPTSRQVISQMVYGGDYIAPDLPATRQSSRLGNSRLFGQDGLPWTSRLPWGMLLFWVAGVLIFLAPLVGIYLGIWLISKGRSALSLILHLAIRLILIPAFFTPLPAQGTTGDTVLIV
jgi:hypothetical protein